MAGIEAGDVVCLKSEINKTHKCLMTVAFVSSTGKATCIWFVNGELKEVNIYLEALSKRA